MALTPSNMLPLGIQAPDFTLPDASGNTHTLDSVKKANGLLVVFMCNHCPYVIHLKEALAEAANKLAALGVGMVGINSNDIANYPDDAPDKMLLDVAKYSYSFPYLFDESQTVAKAYDAACTPDFYLFNGEAKLVYRGQFDGSRPGNDEPVNGKDLYDAVDALLAGGEITAEQKPSVGCNIKWK